MKTIKKIFTTVTSRQCTEFGLVAVLVASFLAYYSRQNYYLVVIFILSLVTLIVPAIFYPFAVFWYGLSKILGAISSRVLLTVIFLVVVIPVGYFRRRKGIDGMKIRQFKKSRSSAMVERNHLYSGDDLLHTF